MASAEKFKKTSIEIAQDFLQTVVIVDDRASYDDNLPSRKELQTPTPGAKPKAKEAATPDRKRDKELEDLDAKILTDTFAEKGLVCAVLKPRLKPNNENEAADTIDQIEYRTDRATQRADIVIIDWRLEEDRHHAGETAKQLIRKIIQTDIVGPISQSKSAGRSRKRGTNRLRLIAIYTGEGNLKDKASAIADFLETDDDITEEVLRNDYTVMAGPVRVVVYGKSGGVSTVGDEDRRVSESELPDRLIGDFAQITTGLLSNVAVASLRALRANTHRILQRFSPDMDAPYVAHRALVEPPDEAKDHPVPLLVSELQGILADDSVNRYVSLDQIKGWLKRQQGGRLSVERVMDSVDEDKFMALLERLLGDGLKNVSHASEDHLELKKFVESLYRGTDRQAVSTITRCLTPTGVRGEERDMEFAILTSLKSQYDSPPPVLTLGTVVALSYSSGKGSYGKESYLLCIQPRCDSVRLKQSVVFPFLKMEQIEDGSDRTFDLVVREDEGYLRLSVHTKPQYLELVKMDPGKEGEIVAVEAKGKWIFKAKRKDQRVRWVADLKPEQASRFAHRFATEATRVGLTESEWLRRMALEPRVIIIADSEANED